jgi:hypothetical protein
MTVTNPVPDSAFTRWLAVLEQRFLADLTFQEVSRALRALSAGYVERRERLSAGAPLDGAGKRAAFALFYAPLHYLLVDRIVRQLPGSTAGAAGLLDLGCGTGAAGAAWARACDRAPQVTGLDRHPWAVAQAAMTYRELGLRGRTRLGDVAHVTLPRAGLVLVAFTLNELAEDRRQRLLEVIKTRAAEGDHVLVVEPLARRVVPWWSSWSEEVAAIGGRTDEWRFEIQLPPLLKKLDRAAGLDHREITGRSAWLAPGAGAAGAGRTSRPR